MLLLSFFVGLENPFLRRVELKLNVVAQLFIVDAFIIHKTQLSSLKFSVELRGISAEYFCVVNIGEKLCHLNLPLLESIRKWLDELME